VGVLEYAGVRLTPAAVEGWEGYRRPVAIPREQVLRIHPCRAYTAAHPVLLLLFGLATLAAGLVGLALLADTFFGDRPVIRPTRVLLLGWLVVPGAGAVYCGLQRGDFLTVETDAGRRRLELAGPVDPAALDSFLRAAEAAFGYTVARPGE
jgi:hypothetical protein